MNNNKMNIKEVLGRLTLSYLFIIFSLRCLNIYRVVQESESLKSRMHALNNSLLDMGVLLPYLTITEHVAMWLLE